MSLYMSRFDYDWRGETVAILASGPTLCQSDIDKLIGKCRVIAVNDSYRLCPWADVLYAADYKWWKVHGYVHGFAGERWTQSIGSSVWPRQAASEGVKVIRGARQTRLPNDRETLYVGNGSSFQAMCLAVMAGAKRIILLGLDLQVIDGRRHWFGDHPDGLCNKSNYGLLREPFRQVAKDLELLGIDVVNCSPRSTLNCFRKDKLDEVLK